MPDPKKNIVVLFIPYMGGERFIPLDEDYSENEGNEAPAD